MKRIALAHYFAAVALGAAYALLATWFWAYYVIDHPINDWLLDTLARQGRESVYYFAIYVHDFVANILIALPFAIGIANLRPNNSWAYVGVALVSALIVGYWESVLDTGFWSMLFTYRGAWPGLLVFAFSLPGAFLVAAFLRRRVSAA